MTAIDTSTLLNYFYAKQSVAAAKYSSSASTSSSSSSSDTTTAPWNDTETETDTARDADVLSMSDYVDDSDVPKVAVTDDQKLEQDNQKLFVIYKALDTLSYLSEMAGRTDVASGVIAGYNTRFQDCLSQIQDYIENTTFNNLELQQTAIDAVTTGTASVASSTYNYTTKSLATSDNINSAVSGVSTSDSFTIAVSKNGTTQSLAIDMADVAATYGTLSLSNIVSYVNGKLSDAGYNTRFARVQTGSKTDDDGNITYQYGLKITDASNETVSLSSSDATPALYLAGTSGLTEDTDDTDANSAGRLVKLSLDDNASGTTDTSSVFSTTTGTTDGTSTATASAVDGDGNVYMLGTTTGDINGEANQGSQDVYISKYDSAGALLWTHLVGSSASADGYDLAIDPTGGVVVVGSTTADLTTSVADGNEDSFVAKFSSIGTEEWVSQINTTSANAANTVSVDSSGNITVGGSVTGKIASGETNLGGSDAYLLQLDSDGTITSKNQFGTTGNDEVASTTYDSSGNLYIVTVSDGVASVSKYAADSDGNVDIAADPTWTQALGTIGSSGAITDIAVSGSSIYVAGSTNNDLNSTDGYSTSGGSDAFVCSLTDNTTSAGTNYVSYVGTSANETSGTLAIGSDGTVYLSGSTTGTFADQSRTESGTTNAFVSAIKGSTGTVEWTKQYGGISGQSTGASLALDADGSSVLDALGLPTGEVQTASSYLSKLTDQSTLKAGDTFKIKIDNGSSDRTATITIDASDTLRTLAKEISDKLGSAGSASVSYASGGKSLKIEASSDYTLTLIAGDDDTDALAGLGLAAGVLSADSSSISTSDGKKIFGLGLTSDMTFSTKTQANAVKAEVSNVLSAIKTIYQSINSSGDDTSTTATASNAVKASTAMLNYIGNRTTNATQALSLLA
jgi:hypothetical protein